MRACLSIPLCVISVRHSLPFNAHNQYGAATYVVCCNGAVIIGPVYVCACVESNSRASTCQRRCCPRSSPAHKPWRMIEALLRTGNADRYMGLPRRVCVCAHVCVCVCVCVFDLLQYGRYSGTSACIMHLSVYMRVVGSVTCDWECHLPGKCCCPQRGQSYH